jgi:hypothetical protein
MVLPVTEPKPSAPPPTITTSLISKFSLFAHMPSFGEAFAGVPPSPIDTTKGRKVVASKIMITLPSPTVGSLDDELILTMVGAETVGKKEKEKEREIELGEMGKGGV